MASGGSRFTLFVTEEGRLWSCGSVNRASDNYFSSLGNNTLLPFCIGGLHFGDTKITSAAGGANHAVAVNEHDCIFTWGTQTNIVHQQSEEMDAFEELSHPGGVGHEIAETMYVVTPFVVDSFHGVRAGRWHRLTRENALAFAMGTHARLGSNAQSLHDDGKFLEEVLPYNFLFISVQKLNIVERVWNFYQHMCMHKEFL